MGTSKTQVEADSSPTTAGPSTEQVQPAPEQHSSPLHVNKTSTSLPPPNSRSSSGIMKFPHSGAGRARISTTMQRQLGNAHLSRMMNGPQAKITVGQPGDRYEQEADDVASRIVSGQKVARISHIALGGQAIPVERQEEEEELLQSKALQWQETLEEEEMMQGLPLQRQPEEEEEEELLQGTTLQHQTENKETTLQMNRVQRQSNPGDRGEVEDGNMQSRLQSPSGGRPLSDGVRSEMEEGLGADFSSVRVHDSTTDQADAKKLNAKAFAYRNHIWLGEGASANDRQLMGHELTHVVQQGAVLRRQSNPEPDVEETQEEDESDVQPGETSERTSLSDAKPGGEATEPGVNKKQIPETPSPGGETGLPASGQKEGKPSNMPDASSAEIETAKPESALPGNTEPLAVPPADYSIEGETEAFVLFREQALMHRDALILASNEKKDRVDAIEEYNRTNVEVAIETEAQRIESTYDESIQEINDAGFSAIDEIEGHRKTKVTETNNNAVTELANLKKTITEKQKAMIKAGEDKAGAAEKAGEEQAQRAIKESRKNAASAGAIGERKVQLYKNYDRANRIARVIREKATELASDFLNTGQEIAAKAREDAAKLTTKFRKESKEAAVEFTDALELGQRKIEQERDETVRGLNDMAAESTSRLDSSRGNAVSQLMVGREGAGEQIRQLIPAAVAEIENGAAKAREKIDIETKGAVLEIDNFVADVATRLGRSSSEAAQSHLTEAESELSSVLSAYDVEMERFIQGTERIISEGAVAAVEQAGGYVTQLAGPVQNAAIDFISNTIGAVGDTTSEMDTLVADTAHAMQGAVLDVGDELQKAIDDSDAEWEKQLVDGKAEIKKKVDDCLAEQSQSLTQFPAKLDEIAEKIENESWLSRALSWIGGIFVGFLEALWEVIKILAVIALIVIAVIAVVLLIAALIGGIAAVLAVIAAVAKVIAAIAGVLIVILKVLAVVLVIVGLLLAAYYIYLSVIRDDLSDYERGKLVGRGLFEFVETVFAAKIISKLGKWLGKLTKAQDVGDAARLGRLSKLVGDDAQLTRLLASTGDDAVKLEKLLDLTSDVHQLERLLNLADNASDLEKLLAKVDDAADLEKLLGKAESSGELLKLFDEFGTPRRVLSVLEIPRRPPVADAYTPIRNITDGSDIERIASATGLSPSDVNKAKKHFMFDEHILVDSDTGKIFRGRFEPFEDVAELWMKFTRQGKLEPDDIDKMRKLMLHESGEAGILGKNKRLLYDKFAAGELEAHLRKFLKDDLGWDQIKIDRMLEASPKPITPYYYAHIKASLTGYPNP